MIAAVVPASGLMVNGIIRIVMWETSYIGCIKSKKRIP